MKHNFFFSLLFTLVALTAYSNPVDRNRAQELGSLFLNTNTSLKVDRPTDLQWATTYHADDGTPAFYVFNHAQGFVIVSADDCALPILGYSDEGPFNPEDHPVQMEDYLQRFAEQIHYAQEHHLEADAETARQWASLQANGRLHQDKATSVVEPLVTAAWGQGCYYNNLCPEDYQGPCGHVLVGCVAVAMGQIMHYWGYPATGTGAHTYKPISSDSYNPSNYPVQTVNFEQTTYQWSNMPDGLSGGSSNAQVNAVATLLWHCGVSVEMMYGVNASGAYSIDVPPAMTNYFNYSSDMEYINRSQYTQDGWLNQIKSSLNMGYPVYYSGVDTQGHGGHAFVCDGYDANNYLHFNWGWYGNQNNYFADGALNVSIYQFNNNVAAITNIHPQNTGQTYTVEVHPNPIYGGTVTGAGIYDEYSFCVLSASPQDGYVFDYWEENGSVVSTNASYSFMVRDNTVVTAHFSATADNPVEATYYPEPDQPNSAAVKVSWDYIASTLAPLDNGFVYNIYRTDASNSETETTALIAEDLTTSAYIDFSWDSLDAGSYRYGVSMREEDGEPMDTLWSNPLVKGTGYQITALANPGQGGIITGAGFYANGATCTLTATPYETYEFVSWTHDGNVISTDPTYSFIVTEDAEYQAHFELRMHTVTTEVDPEGSGFVSPGGTFVHGSVCNLTASSNYGYSFQYWTVNDVQVSTQFSYSFVVTEDAVCVAHYDELPSFTILASASPAEGGVVTGGGNYYINQTCSLSATPKAGYQFLHWTRNGNVIPNGVSFSFSVSQDVEYVAYFELKSYQVNANVYPLESGEISGTGTYTYGATATLSVMPNENYHFVRWTDNGVEVANTPDYTFVVTGNRQLVAHLEYIESINEQKSSDVMLYPNPVHDMLTIESDEPVLQYELYNMTGALVARVKECFGQHLELDVKTLPAGSYLLRLTTDTSVVTRRFVKP